MEDVYRGLGIDSNWTLGEINEYLNRYQKHWDDLAYSRGDEESKTKSRLAKLARGFFESQRSRENYDKALHDFYNPKPKLDPRQVKCQEYAQRANEYIKTGQFDLAEKAILVAMANRDDEDAKIIRMAAHIYNKLGQTDQALSHINEAIVLEHDNRQNYQIKLSILVNDYIRASRDRYIDSDKRLQKELTTRQYMFSGFERDVSPKNTGQLLQVYDFIKEYYIQLAPAINPGMWKTQLLPEFQDVMNNYRQKTLSLRQAEYYKNAIYYNDFQKLSILDDPETIIFCKHILEKNPEEVFARCIVNQHKDEVEKQKRKRESLENEIQQLSAEQKKLEQFIQILRTAVAEAENRQFKQDKDYYAQQNHAKQTEKDLQDGCAPIFILFWFFILFIPLAFILPNITLTIIWSLVIPSTIYLFIRIKDKLTIDKFNEVASRRENTIKEKVGLQHDLDKQETKLGHVVRQLSSKSEDLSVTLTILRKNDL